MGKSKHVGNVKLLIADPKIEKQELFEGIENKLIPIWLEKSNVAYTLDEKKTECWKELLNTLYKSKMLNIREVWNKIKEQR